MVTASDDVFDRLTTGGRPDDVALVHRETRITYAQLRSEAERVAGGLWARGIRSGDVVGMVYADGPFGIVAWLAMMRIGAVCLPLDPASTAPFVCERLADSGARGLFIGSENAANIDAYRRALPSGLLVADGGNGCVDFLELEPGGDDLPVSIPDSAPCMMYFFNASKGVVLSRRAVSATFDVDAEQLEVRADDTILVAGLPAATVTLLDNTGVVLSAGGTVVLTSFDVAEIASAIASERVTLAAMGSTSLSELLAHAAANGVDLSSFRLVALASSSTPPELVEACVAQTGVVPTNVIAIPEVGLFAATPAASVEQKRGAFAGLWARVEARIVDDAGRTVAAGETGTLHARAPNMFDGYYNQPALTAACLEGGWFRTKLRARVDEDGYYWVEGPTEEPIVDDLTAIVYASEIERLLQTHAEVAAVKVVGMPIPGGERKTPVAFVEAVDGALDPAMLTEFIAKSLAEPWHPTRYEFVDSLPRTDDGDIDGAALLTAASDGGGSTEESR